jgi:xanthine dehydrogenase accessory factor
MCIARVVQVEGSGPRDPGATIVISEDGRVVGSVSGGCVEGAVVEESLALIQSGQSKLVRFGYSDDEAFAVGLTCGGIITIFCTPELPLVFDDFALALNEGVPCALATVIAINADEVANGLEGRGLANPCITDERELTEITKLGATVLIRGNGEILGSFGDAALDELIARDGAGVVASGSSVLRHYGKKGETIGAELSVFYESFTPPPKMVIFGAVDFTAALVRIAKVLGYEVTVCDARAPFATTARFPLADSVVVDWPDRYLETVRDQLGPRDCVCVLTHDPKFDVPAITSSLSTKVGYIGAMGSRRTHRDRMARLREVGVSEQDLAKVMSPIGLDLGARTPEETAVAICAEIISQQTGHDPAPLSDGDGPIHSTAHNIPAETK